MSGQTVSTQAARRWGVVCRHGPEDLVLCRGPLPGNLTVERQPAQSVSQRRSVWVFRHIGKALGDVVEAVTGAICIEFSREVSHTVRHD